MTWAVIQIPTDSGLLESVGQLAVLAGAFLLVLMLVGLGAFAYQSVRGDGVRWPDEDDTGEGDEDGLQQGDSDDEWKYY